MVEMIHEPEKTSPDTGSSGVNAASAGASRKAGGCWFSSLVLLCVSLVLSLAIGALVLYEYRYQNRIYPGVRVEPLDLSGMSLSQARIALTQEFQEMEAFWPSLRYGHRVWQPTAAELGVSIDIETTLKQAYAVGREADLLPAFYSQLEAARYGRSIQPAIQFNPAQARRYISGLATELRVPVREASLRVVGTTVEIHASQVGYELDEMATLATIETHVLSRQGGEVDLVIRRNEPVITSIADLADRVERIISQPIELVGPTIAPQNRWKLTVEDLAEMLTIQQQVERDGSIVGVAVLSEAALREYVEMIAQELDRPVTEGRIDFDPSHMQVIVIDPSQVGFRLDVERTVQLIHEHALSQQRAVDLPVDYLRPKIDTDNLAALGLNTEVIKATTYFKGSIADRMKNIELASAQFDGILLAPDEIFSFNRYLGEVSAEKGYADAAIIWGDRTVLGIGGGICQVSTTAFRAAFWAGLEIIERWAHSYRVSWYEPPVGMDATVFSPVLDFKFRNDTPYYLFIKTETDAEAGTNTFYFYGTDTGRTVEMIGPVESNVRGPGQAEYRDDPSLPAGTTRQVETARHGMDVTIKRVVRQAGSVLYADTFISRYQPWNAVFLVGTGGS